MIAGAPKESAKGERRVAMVPDSLARLKGLTFKVQSGAGDGAGFADKSYEAAGAEVVPDAKSLYGGSDLVVKVQPPTAAEARLFKRGSALVSFLYPLDNLPAIKALAEREVTAFAMDLMPRISRAQPMDALTSQSTIAGYKAVTLAADSLPKLFPMLMTAAGTIPPAKVFVVGAGVAGLEAIATAHRLGAVVEAYDVRPAAKEQVESLGARFVELKIQTGEAQTSGGYAKAQSEEFYAKQQELLAERCRGADVVITAALVPGKKAPVLISKEAVAGMRPGSVVVDLAAEQGGNCAATVPGKTVVKGGVAVQGPLNIQSDMAPQASLLYSRNVSSYVAAITKDGELSLDRTDELVKAPMVLDGGKPVYGPLRKALGEKAA